MRAAWIAAAARLSGLFFFGACLHFGIFVRISNIFSANVFAIVICLSCKIDLSWAAAGTLSCNLSYIHKEYQHNHNQCILAPTDNKQQIKS